MYPNSTFTDLAWQRLAAAIAAGNCAKAAEHLDEIVVNDPAKRELIERGRFTSRPHLAVAA